MPDADVSSPYRIKNDPWSSHALALAWLRTLPPGARVLDVGCATGLLGQMCQGMPIELVGLEPNPAWADAARPFYRSVFVGSVEAAPNEALRGFEAVVCADVLEHLPAPEDTLRRLVSFQQSGARFFISVPNVANLWIRIGLLFGRFEYTDRGILDRTHLRFFTRRTFLRFLADCGLQVEKLHVTPIPLTLVHPFFMETWVGRAAHRALAAATRVLPALLGYQFAAELIKP